MARQDRFLTDKNEMIDIIRNAQVIHLGMHDGDDIYVLPMNYGFTWENEELTFYLHGAVKGKKLELLKQNPRIGFSVDCERNLVEAALPCQFSYKFACVAGHGEAELVEDPLEKTEAMKILMSQYSEREFEFTERLVSIVSVIKIKVTDFTGRASR